MADVGGWDRAAEEKIDGDERQKSKDSEKTTQYCARPAAANIACRRQGVRLRLASKAPGVASHLGLVFTVEGRMQGH